MQPKFEINDAYENEFACKCKEIATYQPVIRTTLDGEWNEDELIDDIYDVCTEVMTERLLKKYQHRALKDINLLKVSYMAECIQNQIEDVIELYNKEYDKHRDEKYFGIKWYDEAIKRIIERKLKENLI